jgi:hypothetical protein
MPRPIYTLCSESGAVDGTTGLTSHFNVIEQVFIQNAPPPPNVVFLGRGLTFQVSSLWERLDDDNPEQEFEFRVVLHLPPDGEEREIARGLVKFDKPRFRLNASVFGLLPAGPGVMGVEVRLLSGEAENDAWISHRYEFSVIMPEPANQSSS